MTAGTPRRRPLRVNKRRRAAAGGAAALRARVADPHRAWRVSTVAADGTRRTAAVARHRGHGGSVPRQRRPSWCHDWGNRASPRSVCPSYERRHRLCLSRRPPVRSATPVRGGIQQEKQNECGPLLGRLPRGPSLRMARPLPATVCWLHSMRPPLAREPVTPRAAPHALSAWAYGAAGSWRRTAPPKRGGGGTAAPPARKGGGGATRAQAGRPPICRLLHTTASASVLALHRRHAVVGGRSQRRKPVQSCTGRPPPIIPCRS